MHKRFRRHWSGFGKGMRGIEGKAERDDCAAGRALRAEGMWLKFE